MTKKVLKFGGTSVGSIQRIVHASKIIKKEYDKGNKILVVVSAMAGTTNNLVAHSESISKKFNKRELDVLLTSGEQVTSALIAGALNQLGVKAKSWMNWQIPILTEGEHANARIINMHTDTINKFLDGEGVAVIPGFQGITKNLIWSHPILVNNGNSSSCLEKRIPSSCSRNNLILKNKNINYNRII